MLKNLILSLALAASFSVNAVTIIGIAGGTAAGKTTLAKKLQAKFPQDVQIISQDSYYHDISHLPREERIKTNFDHPDSLNFDLLKEHLTDLKKGKSITSRSYEFASCKNVPGPTIKPSKIIIIDGILLFSVKEIRDLCDLKIFVTAEDSLRLTRRTARDLAERNMSVEETNKMYVKTLKPMHDQFIEPSKEHADLIIPSHKNTDLATSVIESYIKQHINKQK